MFSYVGDRFDVILNGYATSVASALMSYGFPALAAATTLWVLSSGYAIVMGHGATDVRAWAWRAGRVVAVNTLVGTSALYTGRLIPAVDGAMYDLAGLMLPNAPGVTPMSASPWGLIDQVQVAINSFAAAVQTDAGTGGWMFHLDLMAAWLLVAIAAAFMEFVCAYVVLIAKVGETLYLAVGPVFIALAIFDSTTRFFWSWVSCLASAVATMLVAFFLVGLIVYFGQHAIESTVNQQGLIWPTLNLFAQAVGLCGVLFLLAVIAWQAPALGGALTGGPAMQQGGGLVKDVLLYARYRGPRQPSQPGPAGTLQPSGGLGRAAAYAARAAAAAGHAGTSGVRWAYQRAAAAARAR
jgi:type IV secretion system protein VirB6